MPKFIDMTGQQFGRLTVIDQAPNILIGRTSAVAWRCLCACGNEVVKSARDLSGGNTKSCGCWRRDFTRANQTHGRSRDPVYHIWKAMRRRCADAGAPRYGGRGIEVCDRWQHSFANFIADMGERPPGGTVERIDNDGPYSPENCRWASRKEQGRNKANNYLITHDGRTHTISEWAEASGIPAYRIWERIKVLGWTAEEALTRPVRKGRYARRLHK